MDDMKKNELREEINNIKAQVTYIANILSHASSQLIELNHEITRLQTIYIDVEPQVDILDQLNSEEALYDALYRKTRDHYDLYQPILAVIVRDCVKNNGTIPDSQQKKQAEYQCEGIVYFIEDAYKNLI